MIKISEISTAITSDLIGEEINRLIKSELEKHQEVEIDFADVNAMTTFCAKQIFGSLYVSLGAKDFFDRIKIKNANDDLKIIIRIGIESKLNEAK